MDQVSALSYDNGNDHLIAFYERHLQTFFKCSVHSFPLIVLRNVAVKLHASLYFDSDWQDYASRMGIRDNLHLAIIQGNAKMRRELPLYITMNDALQHVNGSVGNIIKALLDTRRLDILLYIKPYVEELLKKISMAGVKGFEGVTEQLPCKKSKNLELSSETSEIVKSKSIFSLNDINTKKSPKVCSIELDPKLFTNYTSCEINALQKNSDFGNPVSDLQLESLNLSDNMCEENSTQELKQLPSAPSQERLSILIQHTDNDTEIAKLLSIKFKEEGFTVTTLSDMDTLLIMDSIGALSAVFQEVDFIVPVVSRKLLQQIHPQIYDKYLESADAMNNRTLYQLIMTEYRNNRCVNLRVRPVLVPDMNRRLLATNVILSYSFRLWEDLPKLIRMLKQTKQLIPQYTCN